MYIVKKEFELAFRSANKTMVQIELEVIGQAIEEDAQKQVISLIKSFDYCVSLVSEACKKVSIRLYACIVQIAGTQHVQHVFSWHSTCRIGTNAQSTSIEDCKSVEVKVVVRLVLLQ